MRTSELRRPSRTPLEESSGRHNADTAMSRRRKHVTLGLREEFEVLEGQSVARVANARGGNLMEVRGGSRDHAQCDNYLRLSACGRIRQGQAAAPNRTDWRWCAQVELPDGRVTLCIMPHKFNKKLWVRKGGFVIVEEHEDAATDTKVTGTIVQVTAAACRGRGLCMEA